MTTAEELDQRYGRTRRRRLPWLLAIIAAVIVVAIAAWMTISQSMNSVTSDDLGFEVVDSHEVTVRFQISDAHGKEVTCAVEALDEEFGVVGWKIVEIPKMESHTQQFTTTVPTVSEATTGLVNACWVA
ncbi:DUF4307 domain-containing protein [Microbacterium sp. A196]|uniref:DUF4307 domain-containing protein n=1 Tax=Microbacterium sp. A196 TaxID=3457320 RepID=UPI003FCF43C9